MKTSLMLVVLMLAATVNANVDGTSYQAMGADGNPIEDATVEVNREPAVLDADGNPIRDAKIARDADGNPIPTSINGNLLEDATVGMMTTFRIMDADGNVLDDATAVSREKHTCHAVVDADGNTADVVGFMKEGDHCISIHDHAHAVDGTTCSGGKGCFWNGSSTLGAAMEKEEEARTN